MRCSELMQGEVDGLKSTSESVVPRDKLQGQSNLESVSAQMCLLLRGQDNREDEES